MSTIALDAEAMCADLVTGVRRLLKPGGVLVGIWSGGAWLAERLQRDLKLPGEHGAISSAMHRDDFAQRGLAGGGQTVLPFDVNEAQIIVLDDVHVVREGGRHPDYREQDGQRVMKHSEITVRVHLHRGPASSTVWTCDLSHDYVSINADYRS